MKAISSAILSLLLSCAAGLAQESNLGNVDIPMWPGVKYELFRVKRIAGDRLLFGVKIVGTAQAPKGGTVIGIKVPIPADASQEDIQSGRYDPLPFSIAPAKMIEEKSGKEYASLAPLPTGQQYVPSDIRFRLLPGSTEIVTVQFSAPPPPVNAAGEPVKEKQTVSLLLPDAKGPITNIPVPPAN